MAKPADQAPLDSELYVHARQVGLVRLLLVALGFGVLTILVSGRAEEMVEPAARWLRPLLVATALAAGLLLLALRWVQRPWQLALHLAGDVLWTALVLYLSGGPASSGVVMLFIIVLTGTLVLPGVFPFVLPALASLVLAMITVLYVTDQTFFPWAFREQAGLANPARLISLLAVQVAALFAVDLLGQLLAKRMRESRIFTNELLDQLGEGVLAVDRRGQVAYVNAEAMRLLALSGAVQGRRADQLLTGEMLAPMLVLLQGQECPMLERFAGPNGRQLVLRVTELVGARGATIGRTLLIADETRLRLLEENSQRSAHLAALGEMSAGIAHEIRNPLTSLRGCAQELAEMSREESHHDAESLAHILVSESDRLARIVDDFLSLSRLRPPRRAAVELGPLVDDLRRLCAARRDLPAHLRLDFMVTDDCSEVDADADQLKQVLTNLVNNALDALRQTNLPTLILHAETATESSPLRGAAVRITVRDNGCGIPVDLQERVFTPFFSTKSQGTGLGLSLVSRIIREHEGALHLDSAADTGTAITIYLPSHSQTRVFKRALGGG